MPLEPRTQLDRRVVRTRATLRVALVELLQDVPVGQLSVTRVAEAADLPRKTFYQHYGSVEELWVDVLDEMLDAFYGRLDDADLRLPFDEAALLRRIFAVWDEHPGVIAAAFTNGVNGPMLERMETRTLALLARVCEVNSLPARDPLAAEYFASFLAGATIGVMGRWSRAGSRHGTASTGLGARLIRSAFEQFFTA